MITSMNHFTIVAEDRAATFDFYVGLMGLKDGPRPDLGFPGAWLYAGGASNPGSAAHANDADSAAAPQAVLHIIFGRPMPAVRTGVIDHLAFSATGLRDVKERLDARGLHYSFRQQAESGIWQLFCFDPNGARVELDFDPSETP